MGSDLMITREIAQHLRITVRHVGTLVAKDGLPAFKVGRDWRIYRKDLEDWEAMKKSRGVSA